LTPFKLLFEEEVVMPEEIKFQSTRTKAEVVPSPIEEESKDLLESDRLKAVKKLHAYQAKTKAWREQKVKQKSLRHRRFGAPTKPVHPEYGQVRTKIGWTLSSSRKLKARILSSFRPQRKHTLAFMKC
jgi:hypothetical protein